MKKNSAVLEKTSLPRRPFKVGETVWFYFIKGDLKGVIIEDRGNLAGGLPLYRVAYDFADERKEIELPAAELKRTPDGIAPK